MDATITLKWQKGECEIFWRLSTSKCLISLKIKFVRKSRKKDNNYMEEESTRSRIKLEATKKKPQHTGYEMSTNLQMTTATQTG